MIANGRRDRCRNRPVSSRTDRRPDHLQVLARQQRAGARNVDRVARQLHAVLRRAERRGADALTCRQQRERKAPRVEPLANRASEAAAKVAEVRVPRARRRIRPRHPRTSRPGCRRSRPAARSATSSPRPRTRDLSVSAATSASAIHAVTRVQLGLGHHLAETPVAPGQRRQPLARQDRDASGDRRSSTTARRPPI